MQWKELYDKAAEKLAPRAVSPFIEAGGVAAAILTAAGNVYTGVCIDTACTLGMCAERSAIANMITNGESRIVRLVCVMGDGRVGMPCGACREFMMQLDKDSPGLEILADAETGKTVRLRADAALVGRGAVPVTLRGGRPPALTGRDGPHGRSVG